MGNETHRMSNFNIKIEELPSLEKSFRQSIDTYMTMQLIDLKANKTYNGIAKSLCINYDNIVRLRVDMHASKITRSIFL